MVHYVLANIQINLSNEIQVIFGKNVQCSLETIINGKQQITIFKQTTHKWTKCILISESACKYMYFQEDSLFKEVKQLKTFLKIHLHTKIKYRFTIL